MKLEDYVEKRWEKLFQDVIDKLNDLEFRIEKLEKDKN